MKCKQLGIKDDQYDKDGIPPPNEDIHIYYIIVKNLHPTTGIADVWQCIPTKQVVDVADITGINIDDGTMTVYVGFKGMNNASKTVRAMPLTLKGRLLWTGHARSKFVLLEIRVPILIYK